MNKYLYHTKKIAKKGFTLIELMVVIAIIGILATIGMSQYSSYTARAQVAEAISILEGAKKAALDYKMNYGVYPPGPSTMAQIYPIFSSLSSSTKYLQTYSLIYGAQSRFTIRVIFKSSGVNSTLAGENIGFSTYGENTTMWYCDPSSSLPKDVVPEACR